MKHLALAVLILAGCKYDGSDDHDNSDGTGPVQLAITSGPTVEKGEFNAPVVVGLVKNLGPDLQTATIHVTFYYTYPDGNSFQKDSIDSIGDFPHGAEWQFWREVYAWGWTDYRVTVLDGVIKK